MIRRGSAELAAIAALLLACKGAGGGGDGGTDVTCDPGWHSCGPGPDDCAPDDSPGTCGTRCTPCPSDPNGTATCVGGACGMSCASGFHLCSGTCVDDGSKDACGPSCLACPAPAYAHSRAACIAAACDYACDAGFLRCASGCCPAPEAAFARVACGALHTCGVTRSGAAKCWGGNPSGQLGDDSPDDSHVPVPIVGSDAVTATQVSASWDHSCGVEAEGGAWCWGGAWAGQLGDGSWGFGNDSRVPVAVYVPGAQVLMTAVGWAHSCGLLAGGAVRCWGNNEAGQLGTGLVEGSRFPAPVALSGESYGVLAGWMFSCAITGPASLECWGDDAYGQLGKPDAGALERAPVPVTNVADVTSLRAVAVGKEHACVAYDAGTVLGAVRCWGRGDSGQLGHGATPSVQRTGVEVEVAAGVPLLDVVALAAGGAHTCAVTSAGALSCWGANGSGQLGAGAGDRTQRTRATPVASLASGVGGVAAGTDHTCALVDVGTDAEALWCWGLNDRGQLGDGTTQSRTVPVRITGF
jgi:alpha-tubulin suppressor-like RCC1 family protein